MCELVCGGGKVDRYGTKFGWAAIAASSRMSVYSPLAWRRVTAQPLDDATSASTLSGNLASLKSLELRDGVGLVRKGCDRLW